MAYTQFPRQNYMRVLESNEEIFLGGISPDFDGTLEHIRVHLFRKGTAGGSETLQLKLYTKESTSAGVYASSNTLNEADWSSGTNFVGILRFDFTNVRLTTGRQYYLSIATANYTRNADTYYLATVVDYPNEINKTNSYIDGLNRSQKFEIFYKA